MIVYFLFFFFKHKTAYEMRISDWSSDVCSSDLDAPDRLFKANMPEHRLVKEEDGSMTKGSPLPMLASAFAIIAVAAALAAIPRAAAAQSPAASQSAAEDRKSTRLNSSH